MKLALRIMCAAVLSPILLPIAAACGAILIVAAILSLAVMAFDCLLSGQWRWLWIWEYTD